MTLRSLHRQRGLSLMELLGALAITAVLMAPLAALLQDAAQSGVTGRAAVDLNADLRFALDRIATRASTITPPPLAPSPGPSPIPAAPAYGGNAQDAATLLGPWTYTLSATPTGTNLVETDPTPNTGHTSVIAANVTAFQLSTPDVAAGQPLVKVDLTLSANGASASGSRTVRVWGQQ